MDDPRDDYGPRSTNHSFYFGICKTQMSKYEKLDSRIKNLRGEQADFEHYSDRWLDYQSEISGLKRARNEAGVIVVVFAAMCLESLIYDYGVSHTSKSYFDRYLDGLSHTKKWVVVPKITTGETIDTGGQAFERLQELVSDRNDLVHDESTSVPMDDPEELAEWVTEREEKFARSVPNAMSAIFKVTNELHSIDPDYPFVSFYDPDSPSNKEFKKYA